MNSFIQLRTNIELVGATTNYSSKEAMSGQEKQKEESKLCKHWNKGFCKNKRCKYVHCKDDCQFHIDGGNC